MPEMAHDWINKSILKAVMYLHVRQQTNNCKHCKHTKSVLPLRIYCREIFLLTYLFIYLFQLKNRSDW